MDKRDGARLRAELPHTQVAPQAHQLDYLSAMSRPYRNDDPRKMFWYLLPGSAAVSVVFASWYIEAAYPGQDNRNMAPCLLVFLVPIGLVTGIQAIRQGLRGSSKEAFAWAFCWGIAIALGPLVFLWLVVTFGWLKHM